jgi:DNA/RNA endonuclease YhcR with UshA esterase domain
MTENEVFGCMKTENKVAAILFIMAFSTLFLLYTAISADTGRDIQEIPIIPTKNDVGKTVYVEGTVLSKRMTFTGNNLLISLDCRTESNNQNVDPIVIIFIPRSSGAVSFNQTLEVGSKIGVIGVVEEYNGMLEVVLKNEKNLFVF